MDRTRLVLYAIVGVVISGLAEALHRALRAARQQSAALRESEAALQSFYESSAACMGLIQLETDDIIHLYDNPATCRFFGREMGSTHGRRASELGAPREVIEAWSLRYRESAERGGPVTFEQPHDFPGKPRRWLSVTVAPVDSGCQRFTYVAVDITTRRESEVALRVAKEAAEAATRAKDEFFAALSHELRNPLNPVLLTAGAALAEPRLDPEAREDWAIVHRNVVLLARLIDDLLDHTRITRGRLALDRRELDAHQVIAEAVSAVRPDFEAKRQHFTMDLTAARTLLEADAGRLQQVLWNLLKNAAKFTPPEGWIAVRTANVDSGQVLRVAVADSGIGLERHEMERVFEPFVQGDHSAAGPARNFGGLGLGLAISREIIQLHDGRLWVESAGRDRGATFFLDLPLAAVR